jgi:hypothetical protein
VDWPPETTGLLMLSLPAEFERDQMIDLVLA